MPSTAGVVATAHREEVFNVCLSQLLRSRGMDTEAEVIHTGGGRRRSMPDVMVEWQGLRIVIEAKFDSPSGRRAVEEQARKRVMQAFGEVGVALIYPNEIRDVPEREIPQALEAANLKLRLYRSGGGPSDWVDVLGVGGVSEVLSFAREQLADENVIDECTETLRDAIEVFARAALQQPGTTEKLLGLVSVADAAAAGRDTIRAKDAAVRICGLALCTATLLQRRLAEREPDVPAVPEDVPVMQIRKSMLGCWKKILEIDYAPVFDMAYKILKEVSNKTELGDALLGIIMAAERVDERQVLGHHDVIGRVYHSLLADRKYLATYFTSVPAAVLLCNLALDPTRWDHIDFAADPKDFDFRIGDLACGTGTLLTEAFASTRANWIAACAINGKVPDLASFGTQMFERNMWGFDVLAYAVQVCAATLFLSSPGTTVERSNLRQMPFGGPEGRLGSLELLRHDHVEARLFGEDSAPVVGIEDEANLSDVERPELDLVVMNPPFTRSVGGSQLLGSLPHDAFAKARDNLRALVRQPDVTANLTAGLGSPFVDLGVRCVRKGGRIALVLPKAVLTGDAWSETRRLLAENFQIEYVIVSHESGRWNFSDSTDLSEALIIGRRWSAKDLRADAQTSWVCLTRNPRSPVEALGVAAAVRHASRTGTTELEVDKRSYGELFDRSSPLDGRPWRQAVFSTAALSDVSEALLNRLPIPVPRRRWPVRLPLRALGEIATVGPDRRDVHDGFTLTSSITPYPAFWGHDARMNKSLAQCTNQFLKARMHAASGRPLRDAHGLWEGAGRLMIPERLRLTTHRCTAVALTQPALSNTWWSVNVDSEIVLDDQIIAMWLNSSLGILGWIGASDETEGPWIAIKKDKLRQLPVLDPSALGSKTRRVFRDAWRSMSEKPLKPLSEIHEDPLRAKLDAVICSAFGIEAAHLASLRQMLDAEPRLRPHTNDAEPLVEAAMTLFDAVAS